MVWPQWGQCPTFPFRPLSCSCWIATWAAPRCFQVDHDARQASASAAAGVLSLSDVVRDMAGLN